jgi:hypothetical protein
VVIYCTQGVHPPGKLRKQEKSRKIIGKQRILRKTSNCQGISEENFE